MRKAASSGVVVLLVIVVLSCQDRKPVKAPSPPTTSWDSGTVVASGGLACRDSATYDRIWKKVAGIMSDHGGDSLETFAESHPGCRRLAEEGEPVQSFKVRGQPYAIELRIRGDSLPLYAHLLAIDTVCSVSWPC